MELGEVIRSIDRVVAASDMLMKYGFIWLEPELAECLLVCVIFVTCFQYFPVLVAVFFCVLTCTVLTSRVGLRRKSLRRKL